MANSPIGRVSYPNVFTARGVGKNDQGEKHFSLTLLIPKEKAGELAQMKADAAAAAKEKWGDKIPKNLQSPFVDGDDKEAEEYKGMIAISFKAKENRPPQIVDEKLAPITEKSGQFYPGCYARVSYRPYAWEYMGKTGVSFGLNNIQKTGDGEAFDGRKDAEDEFEALVSSQDETGGLF